VAAVLRPGGTFVRFWSLDVLDEAVIDVLRAVYAEHAPKAFVYGYLSRDRPYVDPLESHPDFAGMETRIYGWERTLTACEWAELMATVSDHQRLEPERLAALQRGARAAIEALGGAVHSRGETHAWFVRRV
jgi:hypothetical protein